MIMFRRKRAKKEKKSEIDLLANIAQKMNPDELQEYLHKKFSDDLQYFKRIISEQIERTSWTRNQPEVEPILEKVQDFYNGLISDGYLEKDFSLFNEDNLESWKWGQSREEAVSLLRELDESNYDNYHDVFRKWNRVYVNIYETIFPEYLTEPARKICNRQIRNKTRILKTLSEYKNGKFEELFSYLNPHIRNSIQHQDFIIDPKHPKITFHDRMKPPLSLSLEDYSTIFWGLFFLTRAFDTAWFDLRLGIIEILLEEIDTVDEFFKNSDYKLVPKEGGLSLLDYALLIKSGKI